MLGNAILNKVELDRLIDPDQPICYGVLKPGPFVEGGIPLVRILDIEGNSLAADGLFKISASLDKEFARSRLLGGELMLSIQGTVGRVAVFPRNFGSANISRTIARLSFSDPANAPFLKHWFLSYEGQKAIDGAIVGTTRSSLNIGALRKLPVPCLSSAEKECICEILDALDTAIHETEAIIAKLKAVKQGLLHDLLTRGIDANGELRPPQAEAPHLYKESPLGWIPKEWEFRPLQHVADVVDPQPDHRTPREQEQGAPYIGIGDFDDMGDISISTCRKVIWSALEKQERRFTVRSGDIIYGKIGTIGQPKLLPKGRYALTANVLLIQPKHESSFLFHSIDSRQFEKQILEVTNTTSQPALGIETVRLLVVPCPLVEEADGIAKILDAANSKLVCELRSLKKLKDKKIGLMDDLLTGRVRVTPLLAEAAKQNGSA